MTDEARTHEAQEWHRVAEERRRQLERMQDQVLYRTAAAALARGRRVVRRLSDTVEPVRSGSTLLARSALALPRRLRSRAAHGELRAALSELPTAPAGAVSRADVTAVIVTARQPARLDTLLDALDALGVASIVVDNAGVAENAAVIARHPLAERLALTAPISFSAANEQAIAHVTTPWVLLLNDDVSPVDATWLDRMLAAADEGTVAVGAQLVHGPRGLLGGAAVDGLVQHAGVGLILDGPVARVAHLRRGSAPVVRREVLDVPAATAACLLVRVDAHRAVGGFHLRFDYGSEDVDLCLRLADHGRIRVALDAVLLHEEGATRLIDRPGADRRVRTRRQAANRALLDARHAPALRRRIVEETLGSTDSDRGPLRLAFGVAGDRPDVLDEVARTSAVRSVSGGGALTVVVDSRRVPADGGDVPTVGWIDADHPLAAWSDDALDAIDTLLVVGTVDADVEQRLRTHPTLPVVRAAGADEVRAALRDLLLAPRWSLRIGAPSSGPRAARWGDPAVADALRRELRAHGLVVRTVGRDRWGGPVDRAADVTLHLKGRGVAPVADAQTNVVWVMSHPSEVAPGELDAADLVLAGSELLAERYRATTTTPVAVLQQATDARRFDAGPVDPGVASPVLFVGNTRSVPRPVVLGAVDAGLPLRLVGSGWERYVDPRLVVRDHLPTRELPRWYRSADVVLNDHWDDMARWGLVSNRVFDALACGACVVSDEVPGMGALLADAVVTFRAREDVGPVVRALLDDPDERARRAERGRRAVLAAHTWQHRAVELVRLVAEQRA